MWQSACSCLVKQHEMENYYNLLGIDQPATEDEIRKAYKKKIKEAHPDRNGLGSQSHELSKRVNEARDVLLDPVKRREHDRLIASRRKGAGHTVGRRVAGTSSVKAPTFNWVIVLIALLFALGFAISKSEE